MDFGHLISECLSTHFNQGIYFVPWVFSLWHFIKNTRVLTSRFLNQWFTSLDVSKNRGVSPRMDCIIMENPKKNWDDLGGKTTYFWETSEMVPKIDRGCHRRKGIGIFVLEGGWDCTNPSRILAGNVRWIQKCQGFLHKWNGYRGFVENAVFQKEMEQKMGLFKKLKFYNCIRIICHVENVHEPVQIWHYCCWNP